MKQHLRAFSFIALLAATSTAFSDGVIDPGFEGTPRGPSAWHRVVFTAPLTGSSGLHTNQCGLVSVTQKNITRNGYARLDPIYMTVDSLDPDDCRTDFPCVSDRPYAAGLSVLTQGGIQLLQLHEYIELTFDYRTDRIENACEDVCPNGGTNVVAEVRLINEADPANPIPMGTVILKDEPGSNGWRRARMGVLRDKTATVFRVEFHMQTWVRTDAGLNAFRAALEVDNVRLESFALPCTESSWKCPLPPEELGCMLNSPNYTLASFPLVVGPTAHDADAPTLCDRPCGSHCQGDTNTDGRVDGADLGAVLSGWGAPGAEGDTNNDGIVNGLDLAAVLANWGCTS